MSSAAHKENAALGASVTQHKLARKNAAVMAPLPNLFKTTFEHAGRHCPGERWLQQRIEEWDQGRGSKRKQVLQDFLTYVAQAKSTSLEDLFSSTSSLFFARLATWFSVTLPSCYELLLQLKVFICFLAFREQVFVRAFFESGLVVSLMTALSVDYNVPDDARCLVLIVLERLASNGRQHKELLCNQGVTDCILECAADALRWETLRSAGRLLCELFHANPDHQPQVLDALHGIMKQRQPMAQRIAARSLTSIFLGGGAIPATFKESHRVVAVVDQCRCLLSSTDLQVSSDAYCLACQLIRRLGCDSLFFEFAREQLLEQSMSTDEWMALEVSDHPGGLVEGRHSNISRRLEDRTRKAFANLTEYAEAQVLGIEIAAELRQEASFTLKWGLLIFLAKRNTTLCEELVEAGLTETLMRSALDSTQPIRQSAAVIELHRLRVISGKASQIAEAVLVKRAFLMAMTIEEFMAAGDADDFARARFRLRNLWSIRRHNKNLYSASEHELQQRLLELEIDQVVPRRPLVDASQMAKEPSSTAFLTESNEEYNHLPTFPAQEMKPKSAAGFGVPRTGPGRYPVHRLALDEDCFEKVSITAGRDVARGYILDRSYLEGSADEEILEAPFLRTLGTLFSDPLGQDALMQSPLLLDLKQFEESLSHRIGQNSSPPSRSSVAKIEGRYKLQKRRLPALSEATTLLIRKGSSVSSTVLSLHLGGIDEDSDIASVEVLPGCADACGSCRDCVAAVLRGQGQGVMLSKPHSSSLAETSIGGLELYSLEFDTSREELSAEMSSQWDPLAAGISSEWGTLFANDSASPLPPLLRDPGADEQIHGKRVVQRSTLATLVEAPGKRTLHIAPAPYHKCIAFAGRDYDKQDLVDPMAAKHILLEKLQIAGKFPRRTLAYKTSHVSAGTPLSARERRNMRSPQVDQSFLTPRSQQVPMSRSSNQQQVPMTLPSFEKSVDIKKAFKAKISGTTLGSANLSMMGFFPASARGTFA